MVLMLLLPNRIDSLFRRGFRHYEITGISASSLGDPIPDSFIQQGLSLAGKLFISDTVWMEP